MDVTAQGSCRWLSPVFLQGREHRTVPSCSVPGWGLAEGRELPGCPVCAQLGHKWPQPGSCPHWVKGQLSRGGLHLRKLLPFCRGGS